MSRKPAGSDQNSGPEKNAHFGRNAEPAGQKRAAPLSRTRRLIVIVVSSVLAVILVMSLLVYFTGNSGIDLDEMSVAEVHDRTGEQVEGLVGLVEISELTLQDSAGVVFDEEPRAALRAEQAVATQFLAELPGDGDVATKGQAVARYDRVEERFAELFETIRLVQVAVKQYEDAH